MNSDSVEAVLFDGIARLIADAGLGDYQDDLDGTACPITSRSLFDSPGRAIAITVYRVPGDWNPDIGLAKYAVQIRGRGAPNDDLDADELVSPITDLLDGLRDRAFGTGGRIVHLEQSLFRVTAPLGVDDQNRTERADTFDLDVTPPPSVNRPG